MRSIFLALALSACDTDLDPLTEAPDDDALLVLGPTLTLVSTPWVASFNVTVTVTGAPKKTKIQLLSSSNLVGAGVCNPKTAPMCFDIAAPLTSIGTVKSDASGTAVFTIAVANPVADPAVELQAVIIAGANSEKSNPLVVQEHDLGSDNDADGLVAEDELNVWSTDPSDDDSDGDRFFDGTEAAGGTDPLDGGDFPLTYDDDIHPDLYLVECTPCHVNGGNKGGQNLDKYKNFVDAPSSELPSMDRIEPFDPENSYQWHKVNGTQALVGGSGVRMPADGPPFLTAAQLDMLESWILSGALEGPDK